MRQLLLCAAALAAAPLLHGQALAKRLDARLDALPFNRAVWGVAIADEAGRVVYGRNADRLMIPASNVKIVVAAAATAMLSPDFTVRTSVYANGPLKDGVLDGDLVLYGRGDPSFSVRCFAIDTTTAGACVRSARAPFDSLAERLSRAGILSVRGNVVGDGSWFEPELVHPAWEAYDLNWWYAAPVSGLGVNDNAVDFLARPAARLGAPATITWSPSYAEISVENQTRTVGASAPSTIDYFRGDGPRQVRVRGELAAGSRPGVESFAMADPNRFAAAALREALSERGISVLGQTSSTTDSTRYRAARMTPALAEVTGRPLRDWLFPILNTSQNWYAEMLLKQLGRQFRGVGSWQAGLAVERQFLIDSVGIDSAAFAFSDGSGLAANNLMSPRAFVQLLRYMRAHPRWEIFARGLPRAGSAGSLRTRFGSTPAEGRVRAKTGSIARTNTLSGYVDLPDGRFLTFSVMANHHTQSTRTVLARIDSLVVDAVQGMR